MCGIAGIVKLNPREGVDEPLIAEGAGLAGLYVGDRQEAVRFDEGDFIVLRGESIIQDP